MIYVVLQKMARGLDDQGNVRPDVDAHVPGAAAVDLGLQGVQALGLGHVAVGHDAFQIGEQLAGTVTPVAQGDGVAAVEQPVHQVGTRLPGSAQDEHLQRSVGGPDPVDEGRTQGGRSHRSGGQGRGLEESATSVIHGLLPA